MLCHAVCVCVLEGPDAMPRDHRASVTRLFGPKIAKLMILQDRVRFFL